MIDKVYDNAKLTKLIKPLLEPKKEVVKITVFPDLIHFPVIDSYNMALPAGTIVGINSYTVIAEDVKDASKKEFFIDIQFMENGELTTKSIPLKAGVTVKDLNIKIVEGLVNFSMPSSEVLYSNITLTFLPAKRMEIT